MKILNLYFKNINSLEGESRIHFDKAPIAEGGVFAITGPNGSGKSSILDAITLGLYGETFRFDRPAEHVMTKSTAESFAEVEFSLDDDQYRASWRVVRADGNTSGELQSPEMKLVQLNGSEKVLEESTQKVRDRMNELTGMDFHKFSKSMVLAQGDFAAFLNALDSERMDILEKISGFDIYDDYSRQAEEKSAQAQEQLQRLEQDLNATPVLDEVAREAREHDLADFKEQLTELETEQSEVQRQLAWVQNIASLEKQGEALGKQLQQLKSEQGETLLSLDKIESAQGMLALEEEMSALDSKAETVQQSKKTLDSYREEVEMLQQQLKSRNFDENTLTSTQSLSQQKESIDQLTQKLTDLKFALPKETALLQSLKQQKEQKNIALNQIKSWLEEHDKDKSLLEKFPEIETLKKARDELAELEKKQQSNSKWAKKTTASIAKKKSEVEALAAKNKSLKSKISENEQVLQNISEGKSLQELQEMLSDQQERVINFQELFDLATVNSKLGKRNIFSSLFSSKNEGKEEKLLAKEHDLLQLEIGREKNIIATLEAAVANEALLKKMEPYRQHLVDGKPCPLCGALEHPYSKHQIALSNSKQVLKEQKKKINALLADEKTLNRQIVLAKKQAVNDSQKDEKLQNMRSKWTAIANRLNVLTTELDIDNLSLMKDLLKAEKKQLSNISNLLKQVIKLQKTVEQAHEFIATNEAALERATKEAEALTAEWDNRPKETIETEKAYSQAVEQEKALSEKVKAQLELLGEKMPEKAKEEAVLFKQLNNRKQEYQKQSLHQKILAEEIHPLNEKIIVCSEKIDTFNKDIQQYSDTIQQQEVAGLHLSLTEKQKMIAEKETAFAQQETELSALKQTVQDKVKETGAIDLTAAREAVALAHRQPEMQQKHQQLSEKAGALSDRQEQLKSELESEQALAVTQQTEYDLTGQQGAVKRKLDIAKQEVLTLQNKLDKQDAMRQKQGEILSRIADQEKQLEACEADTKLMSAENGIHFRRKVQKVISDRLMTKTNQVLEKISGRYYLRKAESEHGLALEIEDTKQHNVRRLPKTLSGGESFIVSLALALGLAEMSQNGHAVDSLFLDEGFGNLDAESLYLVMTTLESLKTHGKSVGVISHVEGVRKRIKTQIEMIKKPNGLSALKIVS